MHDAGDPISDIAVHVVTKPLPRPLQLGPVTVTERRYAVLHLRTASGLVGAAYAQTRGAPIADIVAGTLSPLLVGRDSASIEARWRDAYRGTIAIGRTGLVMRALSLVDVALWDVQAQRAGLPLYRLLGGVRAEVPVMMVAGYPDGPQDVDETVAAAVAAADAGHPLVKFARAANRAVNLQILERLADALPAACRVVVDASWIWERPADALAEASQWSSLPVAWLEDPFPPERTSAYTQLRRQCPVPVGAGDEAGDSSTLERLLDAAAVDILRLDLMTVGGITAGVRVIHDAERRGVPVSLHISPEVSAHVAAAFPAVTSIETFDRGGNRLDPSHELVAGGPAFRNGMAVLPETAGAGWTLPEQP